MNILDQAFGLYVPKKKTPIYSEVRHTVSGILLGLFWLMILYLTVITTQIHTFNFTLGCSVCKS